MKRTMITMVTAGVTAMLLGAGCSGKKSPALLQEGVIFTVQWTDGAGKSKGLSRLDSPQTVPSGNGSWNMDLYGRLFSTHLEIVNRQVKGSEPQIIPIQRLDSIQFGAGGRTFPSPEEKK